ncbi:hypothetical protein M0G74_04715 [Microbulbifer sp. CAU 1566]|uniref:hypothetical protein n=1 Tax=Microbulbifer sp. CAU 1566 TaxID=2933269 RepID=UPI0020047E9C|nr:hypothetical protein [Microbulbifer sp. CAU 1566]MCK7596573.1 hypothetical protein [Microbulbifer sp. CAU 1566]
MLRTILCIGTCIWSLSGWAGMLAEGRSSVTEDATIEAGWRMYTLYTGPEACEKSSPIAHMEVEPGEVRVRVGETWEPKQLVVRAFDTQNRFVPAAPLTVSLYEDSELVDIRGSDSKVRGVRAGWMLLVIQGICAGASGQDPPKVEIPFVVVG